MCIHFFGTPCIYNCSYKIEYECLWSREITVEDIYILPVIGHNIIFFFNMIYISGFGGLGVACWPLVPKFAGSNPAEAVAFLRAKKSSARLPSEGK